MWKDNNFQLIVKNRNNNKHSYVCITAPYGNNVQYTTLYSKEI